MLIYCQNTSPRIKYIFDYIFCERLGINYKQTNNIAFFVHQDGVKINYSTNNTLGGMHISPTSLLFETGLIKIIPIVKKEPYLHLFPQKIGDLEFDIFSACFWLLSRCEEYHYTKKDKHGRFCFKDSLAFQEDFLERPIIDEWIILFKNRIKQFFKEIEFKKETFETLPTIDIDSGWCYKNKGIFRIAGASFKDLIRGNWKHISDRTKVVLGLKKDPHYQFSVLKQWYLNYNLKPIFFVLCSQRTTYDKNTSVRKQSFKQLIKMLQSFGTVGIHFSYYASEDMQKMKSELKTLSKLTNENITYNRQHYLKFQIPNYYRQLEKQGITDDFSMGYAGHIGFRAGTSRPFLFYDLEQERISHLRIHPFSIMDVSLKNYQNKSFEEASVEISKMINQLKAINGKLVTLWHNESLSNYDEWENWQKIYPQMLKHATE